MSIGSLPAINIDFPRNTQQSQMITFWKEVVRSFDYNQLIDIMIIDFSKAFDAVAHQQLLMKHEYYGICDKTQGCIKSWFSCR